MSKSGLELEAVGLSDLLDSTQLIIQYDDLRLLEDTIQYYEERAKYYQEYDVALPAFQALRVLCEKMRRNAVLSNL